MDSAKDTRLKVMIL